MTSKAVTNIAIKAIEGNADADNTVVLKFAGMEPGHGARYYFTSTDGNIRGPADTQGFTFTYREAMTALRHRPALVITM